MNPKYCPNLEKSTKTYEKLKEEYDAIKYDIETIKHMEISEEAKKLPLDELQKQINEVKEKMHNYIDTL